MGCSLTCSLRSKRFRGVGEQRKTEERDFRCFARMKNGAGCQKALSPFGSCPIFLRGQNGSRPIFRAGKTPKIPFFSLFLLTNPTETLATQAI